MRLSSFTALATLLLILAATAQAQSTPELQQILQRLDRLEQENRALAEEVRALKNQLASPLEEKVDLHERRIEENAQTKVEASQRFPIRISGMALFNAFLNSRQNGGVQNPIVASGYRTPGFAGATLRQSVLGLNFEGPKTIWNGKIHGNLYMDFFAGGAENPRDEYEPYTGNLFRIRTASIQIDWKNRSLMFGQEKPVIAPREPNSLAQVGVSPLTGAGNLWLWQPQARFEQRFQPASGTAIRAQIGLVQTTELSAELPAAFRQSLERARPGLQGRIEIAQTLGEGTRIAIAPGFHASTTHVAGTSVPSNLFSLDWFAKPWRKLEFSGAFFTGKNVANLGALRQGFTILGPGNVIPVHGRGGWAQFSYLATQRLTFHIFGGQHDNRNSDLLLGGIAKNQSYAGNVMYHLAPNVIFSFESSQVRTTYLGRRNWLNNHYDLALAYLF